MKIFKKYPKLTALLGAAAVAGAAYYGVPPEYTQDFLKGACATLGC
jgi:hypothetical protein